MNYIVAEYAVSLIFASLKAVCLFHLLAAFRLFPFSLVQKLDYDMPRCSFVMFILLGVYWDSCIYELMSFIAFEKLSAIISSHFFLPHSLAFSFWDSNYTNIGLTNNILHISYNFFLFLPLFFFCFSLYSSYGTVFEFTIPFFCCVQHGSKPIQWIISLN